MPTIIIVDNNNKKKIVFIESIGLKKMVKYICFCMMAKGFLKLDIEEKKKLISEWSKLAHSHGIKVMFLGSSLGIKEHGVVAFDTNGSTEKFLKFKRKWLSLGTQDAGKYLQYIRVVTVH